LIQIAHNVEIGENTVIAAQTGVAGSTKIGKNAMIGGQVGIIGHFKIADGVKIAAQSGIGQDITEKTPFCKVHLPLPLVITKEAMFFLEVCRNLKNKFLK
jgi:UDP-3-O-[3-hydroxymyristoyl] glucosamine N-acyltransferase